MLADYYADDLSPDSSLITLERADAILATTLQGREWTYRAAEDRRACLDDPTRQPDRQQDKAALCDASRLLSAQQWRGRKVVATQRQAFPRAGLSLATGEVVTGIPSQIEEATAILAAHLVIKADQSVSADLLRSYQIGEVKGEFRAPLRNDLPRPVIVLIQPFLKSGACWSPLTA